MLKENICYDNGFPIDVKIVKIEEYPLHYHQDIELIFVLKGSIKLSCGYCTYIISKDNIFTLNGREVHGMYEQGGGIDNIVALIRIDNYYFLNTFPEISKSCFRTNTINIEDVRTSDLRNLLLQLLLTHIQKSPDYKYKNILKMEEILNELYANFHYFSMEKNKIINCKNDNQVLVSRVSNIINYIYENYSKKLTLQELAEKEYLSTFYLSHIIKKGTGMNFREFLCFARVESSQRFLLDINKKINVIANEVGFSTTAYYIKYFKKWFGLTPEEYRKEFLHNTKSPQSPSNLKTIKLDEILQIIKKEMSLLDAEHMSLQHPVYLKLQFTIDSTKQKLYDFNKHLVFKCSKEHIIEHRLEIGYYCKLLNIDKLLICCNDNCDKLIYDEYKGILDFFSLTKTELSLSILNRENSIQKYGYDSIIALSFILKRAFLPNNEFININSLADFPHENNYFNGEDGILTCDFVPKPSFYAYQIINIMKGELIAWSKYHAVTRKIDGNGKKHFYILVLNQDDDLDSLCLRPSSLSETIEKIKNYKKIIDLTIKLEDVAGSYLVGKMKFDQNNMFLPQIYYIKNNCLSLLDNPLTHYFVDSVVSPKVELYNDTIEKDALFNITLSGIEIQLITLNEI